MFKFPKKQRISNETAIKKIFSEGNSISVESILVIWKESFDIHTPSIKALIVVPKKKVKLAVHRNSIKRKIKEAYRLNKSEIENVLKAKEIKLHVAIIYQNENDLSFNKMEEKIKLILNRLLQKI